MESKEESMSLFELGLKLAAREDVKDLKNNTFAPKTKYEITQDILKKNAEIRRQDILDLKKVLDNLEATNEEIEKTRRICTEVKNKLKREKILNSKMDIKLVEDLDNYVELLEHIIIECNDRLKGRAERETIDTSHINNYPDLNSKQADQFDGLVNHFNGQPLDEVREHFSQLCNKNNPIFTECQLNDFIKRAFCFDTSIDKITISLTNNKPTIGRVFYSYYNNVKNTGLFYSSKDKNTKESYVKLISDNINNFSYNQAFSNCRS